MTPIVTMSNYLSILFPPEHQASAGEEVACTSSDRVKDFGDIASDDEPTQEELDSLSIEERSRIWDEVEDSIDIVCRGSRFDAEKDCYVTIINRRGSKHDLKDKPPLTDEEIASWGRTQRRACNRAIKALARQRLLEQGKASPGRPDVEDASPSAMIPSFPGDRPTDRVEVAATLALPDEVAPDASHPPCFFRVRFVGDDLAWAQKTACFRVTTFGLRDGLDRPPAGSCGVSQASVSATARLANDLGLAPNIRRLFRIFLDTLRRSPETRPSLDLIFSALTSHQVETAGGKTGLFTPLD